MQFTCVAYRPVVVKTECAGSTAKKSRNHIIQYQFLHTGSIFKLPLEHFYATTSRSARKRTLVDLARPLDVVVYKRDPDLLALTNRFV